MHRINHLIQGEAKLLLYFAWVVSIAASLGSLIYSEILYIPPCSLCWIQRILMYCIVFLLFYSLVGRKSKPYLFAISFSIFGAMVAFYQILLQAGMVSIHLLPCTSNVSCAVDSFRLFGLFSIPFQSFVAFVFISVALLSHFKFSKVN